jgi:predicted PurR-regulated permease PerM
MSDPQVAPEQPGAGQPLTRAATIFSILALGLLLWLVWLARESLGPYVISILFIYMLLPVVHAIERLLPDQGPLARASRPIAAVGASVLALVLALILIGTLLGPVIDETEEMLLNFSTYWQTIKADNPDILSTYRDVVPEGIQAWLESHIQQIGQDLVNGIASVAGWLLQTTGSAVSTVLALVSIPLFITYYLIDQKATARTLRAQFPTAWSEDGIAIFRIVDRIFGAYTRGVILEAVIVGTITGFGYWLIGVDVFLPLGVVAFVGEIVPIIGPWIAFFISFPVVLATQPELAIPALALFLVIQLLEGWFLAPQIQGHSNDFTNSGTLLILAIGGAVAGGLGIILALPAAGLLRALAVYTFLRLQGNGPEAALGHLPAFRAQPGRESRTRSSRPEPEAG